MANMLYRWIQIENEYQDPKLRKLRDESICDERMMERERVYNQRTEIRSDRSTANEESITHLLQDDDGLVFPPANL